jgi:hypothetical protein
MLMALQGAIVPAHLASPRRNPRWGFSHPPRFRLNISGCTDASICVSGTPVSADFGDGFTPSP